MIEETVKHLGRLDFMICNGGYHVPRPLLEIELDEVERTWAVCMWGVLHCSQLAARQMVEQGDGGSIVLVSSVQATRSHPGYSAYAAAKAAVNRMAACWAAELAPHGIRVNAVEPGWIDTPGERERFESDDMEEDGRHLPMGRLGRPEEIARAVAFLVSDEEASYVTESVQRVDGGYVLAR